MSDHLFKPGNQIWNLRSKHGRDKLFASPALMLEAAQEYFKWCDDNPFEEEDFRGKDAERVVLHKMRPYTIQGLTNFLCVNLDYFNDFNNSLRGKNTKEAEDFSRVIAYIKQNIYNQKFSGAASGFFNANIIARDLGLSDKQTVVNTDIKGDSIDYSKLSPEVLKQIADASKDQPDQEQY